MKPLQDKMYSLNSLVRNKHLFSCPRLVMLKTNTVNY